MQNGPLRAARLLPEVTRVTAEARAFGQDVRLSAARFNRQRLTRSSRIS